MDSFDNFADEMIQESSLTGAKPPLRKRSRLSAVGDVMWSGRNVKSPQLSLEHQLVPGVSLEQSVDLGNKITQLDFSMGHTDVFLNKQVADGENATFEIPPNDMSSGTGNEKPTDIGKNISSGVEGGTSLNPDGGFSSGSGNVAAVSNKKDDSLPCTLANHTFATIHDEDLPVNTVAYEKQTENLQSVVQLPIDQETLKLFHFIISADATEDMENPAYKFLQVNLQNSETLLRLVNWFKKDIISQSIHSKEADKMEGAKELNKLLEGNKNVNTFLALLGTALIRISQSDPVMASSGNPTEMEQEDASNTGGDDELYDTENLGAKESEIVANGNSQNAATPAPEISGASISGPVVSEPVTNEPAIPLVNNAVSNHSASIYDNFGKVKDEFLAVAHKYRSAADTHKMLSSCGKIALHAAFSMDELKKGNPSGRKLPNSTDSMEKYDITKIIAMSKFLQWAKIKKRVKAKGTKRRCQPSDCSMENFKRYESIKNSGLSEEDFKYFWDTVIVKYTSDLRKGM